MASFRNGDKVEVKTLGVWFPATVLRSPPSKRRNGLIYVSIEEAPEGSRLRAFAEVADVRPAQPPERQRFYGIGEEVEVLTGDAERGWRKGCVRGISEDSKYLVEVSGDGDGEGSGGAVTLKVDNWGLRPYRVWADGCWVPPFVHEEQHYSQELPRKPIRSPKTKCSSFHTLVKGMKVKVMRQGEGVAHSVYFWTSNDEMDLRPHQAWRDGNWTVPLKVVYSKVGDLLNNGLEAVLGRAETGIGSRIAIIDSGIFLSHHSFKDKGIPRPPGSRYYDPDRVNNKVIKNKEYKDVEVRDNMIKNEADSKVTYEVDSVATYRAMLDAIDDGVDVISISLGAAWNGFDRNPIAMGACRAAMKNVLVVCAGGNDGPGRDTVVNCKFPWMICVGATHTHTRFHARVELGNNTTLCGESGYTRSENDSLDEQVPLVLFESVDAMTKAPKGQLLGKLVAREFPGWTRLEIKGALLTTADFVDTSGRPIRDENGLRARLWDIGCGLVNLDKARNPGLLYPVDVEREIPAYLRGFGHTNDEISCWVGFQVSGAEIMTAPQLSYPSFRIQFTKTATTKFTGKTQKYTRKVRNVGGGGLRYKVDESDVPSGVAITVIPPLLEFSDDVCQVLDYEVAFELKDFPSNGVSEGSITWISDKGHVVRSPILAELLD